MTRIGTIKSLSEYCPTRLVIGTNGDFPEPLGDMLYYYFKRFYAGSKPPPSVFDAQNEPPNPKSTYHVFIRRGPISGDHKQAMGLAHWADTYVAEVYVRKKSMGEIFPELETMISEIKRIFIEEYESYGMAGIRVIDNFRSGQPIPPESPRNPFQGVWLVECQFTVYYATQVLLQPVSYVYNGYKYAAGIIRSDFG